MSPQEKGDWRSLVKNDNLTIEEIQKQVKEHHQQSDASSIAIFIYTLLRDNKLCLNTRLHAVLILSSLAEQYPEISPYLYDIIGDVYDGSKSIAERTVCSWILAGSVSAHLSQTIPMILNSISDSQEVNICKKVHKQKDKSPHVSFGDEMIQSIYPDEYLNHDSNITSLLLSFEQNPLNSIIPTPQFQRPTNYFKPLTTDYMFPSPLHFTPSFIYMPITQNSLENTRKLITLGASQPLSEKELKQLHSEIDSYKIVIKEIVEGSSMITATRLRSLIATNPFIALDIIRETLKTQRKQQILDMILQSSTSIYVLHIVSQLVGNELVPTSFFSNFVERTVKNVMGIKDMSVQTHFIQCFSFFLAALYKKRIVDHKFLNDVAVKLKESFGSIAEVACLVFLISKGDLDYTCLLN